MIIDGVFIFIDYRIGNTYFKGNPKFGMEHGGLFEERAKFWRMIGAHSQVDYSVKNEL